MLMRTMLAALAAILTGLALGCGAVQDTPTNQVRTPQFEATLEGPGILRLKNNTRSGLEIWTVLNCVGEYDRFFPEVGWVHYVSPRLPDVRACNRESNRVVVPGNSGIRVAEMMARFPAGIFRVTILVPKLNSFFHVGFRVHRPKGPPLTTLLVWRKKAIASNCAMKPILDAAIAVRITASEAKSVQLDSDLRDEVARLRPDLWDVLLDRYQDKILRQIPLSLQSTDLRGFQSLLDALIIHAAGGVFNDWEEQLEWLAPSLNEMHLHAIANFVERDPRRLKPVIEILRHHVARGGYANEVRLQKVLASVAQNTENQPSARAAAIAASVGVRAGSVPEFSEAEVVKRVLSVTDWNDQLQELWYKDIPGWPGETCNDLRRQLKDVARPLLSVHTEVLSQTSADASLVCELSARRGWRAAASSDYICNLWKSSESTDTHGTDDR